MRGDQLTAAQVNTESVVSALNRTELEPDSTSTTVRGRETTDRVVTDVQMARSREEEAQPDPSRDGTQRMRAVRESRSPWTAPMPAARAIRCQYSPINSGQFATLVSGSQELCS